MKASLQLQPMYCSRDYNYSSKTWVSCKEGSTGEGSKKKKKQILPPRSLSVSGPCSQLKGQENDKWQRNVLLSLLVSWLQKGYKCLLTFIGYTKKPAGTYWNEFKELLEHMLNEENYCDQVGVSAFI